MPSTLQEERLECRGFLRPIDLETRCVAPSCKLILDTTCEPGMLVTMLMTMATPNLGVKKHFHKEAMPHSHLYEDYYSGYHYPRVSNRPMQVRFTEFTTQCRYLL